MRHVHTVVIGGGPGGLACATALARSGIEVLLMERKPQPGPKVCAGGVTWAGLGAKLPPELIERAFVSQKICSRWQTARVSTPRPLVSTVNRQTLGEEMARQARAAGATLLTDTRVLAIADRHVDTTAGRFGYRCLVGADGSQSLVRRYLGIATERVGVGINCQLSGEFAEMEWHLDTSLFRSGYAWIFPHRHSASVGAYASRAAISAATLLARFREWCAAQRIDISGCRPRAAVINYDYRGLRFGNRFLVGDAAGLASGLTGEGIYPAVISGEAVARLIVDPAASTPRLDRVVQRQQRHNRLLALAGSGPLLGGLVMEGILLGLRSGLIPCSALEMGEEEV